MIELNKIYCGNNIEVMKNIDDESIDMVLTSPPYDNLRNYEGYTFNFEKIAKELLRVLRPGGVVVWVVGDATVNGSETGTSFKQALYFKEVGFSLHDTMIWRRRTLPQYNNRYEPAFEFMFILSKGNLKTFNSLKEKAKYQDNRKEKYYHRDKKTGDFSKNIFTRRDEVNLENVWDIPNRGNEKTAHEHPAIFPEKLAADHIISWSNKGDLILDPFNGSGTTTKMAQALGRNFIGIDISKKYCDIANERLRQKPLF